MKINIRIDDNYSTEYPCILRDYVVLTAGEWLNGYVPFGIDTALQPLFQAPVFLEELLLSFLYEGGQAEGTIEGINDESDFCRATIHFRLVPETDEEEKWVACRFY